jgi:hypothetical protein
VTPLLCSNDNEDSPNRNPGLILSSLIKDLPALLTVTSFEQFLQEGVILPTGVLQCVDDHEIGL